MKLDKSKPFYKTSYFPIYCTCFILLCLHLGTLMLYPAPFPDEPWNGSRALSLLKNGHPFGSLDEGYRIDVARPWAVFPLLPILFYAIPTYFSGQVEIFGLRLVNLAFGFLLLFSLMQIGGRYLGRKGMLAAALATGFSQVFFYSAHLARPDIMGVSLVFLSLSLLSRRPGTRHPLLAGALSGLALCFHLRTIVAIPFLGLSLLFTRGLSLFREKETFLLVGGYILGAAVYPLLHILPDPPSFFSAWSSITAARTPPLAGGEISSVWRSLLALLSGRTGLTHSGLLLPLGGACIGLFFGNKRSRTIVVFALLCSLAVLFVVRDPILPNLIILSPLLDLLTLPLYLACLRSAQSGFLGSDFVRTLLRILTLGLFSFHAYSALYLPLQGTKLAFQEFSSAQAFINQYIQGQDRVIGPQIYWLGQQDRQYFTWEGLQATAKTRDTDLAGAFRILDPDVFIYSQQMRFFVSDTPKKHVWYEELRVPKAELESFLARNASLVARTFSPRDGTIEIYRFQRAPGLRNSQGS